MDVYLRASNGTYLSVGRGQDPLIAADSPQVNYNALISIHPYEPNARSLSLEAPSELRNGQLVTLYSADGRMLAPDTYGMLHPNGAKSGQLGYNVYRVYKLGGAMDDPIGHGDQIAFRLIPPSEKAQSPWMSISGSESVVNFCNGAGQPTETEQFQVFAPVDLREFLIEYDDLYNEVVVHIALTGAALPGGHAVRLESPDGEEFFPTTDVIVGESPWFVIPMSERFAQMTPANRRKISVRAIFQSTGTCLEQPFVVEGDRALFARMEIQKVVKLPPKSKEDKTRVYDVDVVLSIDCYDRRLKPDNLPLNVTLHAGPDGVVRNLTQAWNRLTLEHAIPFRFSIEQPPADSNEPVRSTIIAHYRLNGIERQSQFEVRVTHKGILVDPR